MCDNASVLCLHRWTGTRCVCAAALASRRTSTSWTRSTSREAALVSQLFSQPISSSFEELLRSAPLSRLYFLAMYDLIQHPTASNVTFGFQGCCLPRQDKYSQTRIWDSQGFMQVHLWQGRRSTVQIGSSVGSKFQRCAHRKTEVVSLLESAGFSRANPYYVVQQGKVCTLQNAYQRQPFVPCTDNHKADRATLMCCTSGLSRISS